MILFMGLDVFRLGGLEIVSRRGMGYVDVWIYGLGMMDR